MRETKWSFFPFDPLDYKAAQAWLDKKAEKGWVLEHIYLRRIAKFIPAQGRHHFVDLDLNTEFHMETGDDYLQLCEDAGWELVRRNPGMLIFRSRLGARPAPIQSDSTIRGMDYIWGKLDWGEITSDCGFDQICFARNNSCLILQQGGYRGLDRGCRL